MNACRAAGLAVLNSEITLTTSECCTEELPIEEESQLNLDEVYDQLESLKQRALQLRKALVCEQTRPQTTLYAKCLQDMKTNGSQHAEVHQMQLLTAQLAGQVAVLACRLKSESKQLKVLDCRLQKNQLRTQKLETNVEKLQKWPKRFEHQAAMCIERYSDLGVRCCTYDDYYCFMEKLWLGFMHNKNTKVALKCYMADQHRVVWQLMSTREMLYASSQLLMQHSNLQHNLLVGRLLTNTPLNSSVHLTDLDEETAEKNVLNEEFKIVER